MRQQKAFRTVDPRRIEVIDGASADVIRRMTGGEKVLAACRLSSSARAMLRHQLAQAHQDWSAEQVEREIARRVSGGAI